MSEHTGQIGAHGRHRDRGTRLVKISDLARMSGVPRPTIKHYMREGLLSGPAKRTSRNMAYYDPRLAARIRTIKELQKRHCLPLRVIADLLQPSPSSELRGDLTEDERNQLGGLLVSRRALRLEPRAHSAGAHRGDAGERQLEQMTDGVVLTRQEVLMSLRVSEADLGLLHELGLIQHSVTEAGDIVYTGADLELLEIVDDARKSGLGAMFARDPLASYARAVRDLVRAERALMAADPHPREDQARRAHQVGARLIQAIRRVAVSRESRTVIVPDEPADRD